MSSKYNVESIPADVPVGTVVFFAGTVIPDGWRVCNGSSFGSSSTSGYVDLFNLLGYSQGIFFSNAKLPDYDDNGFLRCSTTSTSQTTGGSNTTTIQYAPTHNHNSVYWNHNHNLDNESANNKWQFYDDPQNGGYPEYRTLGNAGNLQSDSNGKNYFGNSYSSGWTNYIGNNSTDAVTLNPPYLKLMIIIKMGDET